MAIHSVFCIGSINGDCAKIIQETNAGIICDFKDKEKMKIEIMKLYQQFKNHLLFIQSRGIELYSRKELTKQLADIMNLCR